MTTSMSFDPLYKRPQRCITGGYTLRPHGRYGHDPDYIESLPHEIGFSVAFQDQCDGRLEGGQPVTMGVYVLRRRADPYCLHVL